MPLGMTQSAALQKVAGRASSGAGSVELADYLPGCKGPATKLHAADSSITAACLNTTAFIEDQVRLKQSGGHVSPVETRTEIRGDAPMKAFGTSRPVPQQDSNFHYRVLIWVHLE